MLGQHPHSSLECQHSADRGIQRRLLSSQPMQLFFSFVRYSGHLYLLLMMACVRPVILTRRRQDVERHDAINNRPSVVSQHVREEHGLER